MKIPFLFDFIKQIQTIMLLGYNSLTHVLAKSNDMYEQKKSSFNELEQQIIINSNTCSNCKQTMSLTRKEQYRMLEQLDNTLSDFTVN